MTPPIRPNPVRATLLSGGSAWGVMAFEFFTPGLPFVLAAAGAEFVLLDMEHSGIGIETIKQQVAFAKAAGIVPMVRVPGHGYHLVAPVLDAGAQGIMLPMTETRAQAEALVSWCRYRPEGKRGLGFGVGHDDWRGADPRTAMRAANETVLTIALIESAAGVENAHEILSVPGIDLAWLGHYDLSDSLGVAGDFDHPRYRAASAASASAMRSRCCAARSPPPSQRHDRRKGGSRDALSMCDPADDCGAHDVRTDGTHRALLDLSRVVCWRP